MAGTKNCIACAEEILEAAKLCKHCGTMQDGSNFQEQPKPILIPHECHHETLASWAKRDSRFHPPKIKDIVRSYGDALFLASFDTVRKLGAAMLSAEMIFTDKYIIFGSYGGFVARTEIYPLSDFDSILIADSYNDSVHSKIIGFAKNNEFPIDLRRRSIGKGFGNMSIEDFNSKMQLVAGHIPICETGEVFESHTQYFYGIGFSQSLG